MFIEEIIRGPIGKNEQVIKKKKIILIIYFVLSLKNAFRAPVIV